MKCTKLMLGTMILGLGMAGAAWAQPAPNQRHDSSVYSAYSNGRGGDNRARNDRDDANNWRANNAYQRGDGDRDRDDRGAWNARDNRDHRNDNDNGANAWRGQPNVRDSWNWGHSNMRRGDRDDR